MTGEQLYTIYCGHVHDKSITGLWLRRWDQLTDYERTAWNATAGDLHA